MAQADTVQWYDNVTPVWDQGADVRGQFIVKTYTHLAAAVVLFVAAEVALFTSGIAQKIAAPMMNSWLLVLGGFVIVGFIGTKVANTAKSRAAQYAALAAYVLVEALIFVPLLYIAMEFAGPGLIESAALITLIGFAGLTGIAFYTRKDFSFLRGLLMWGGIAALLLIVAAVVFGFTLGPIFAVAMIALAGAGILYDTSNVLHHYPPERYVGASLSLFASVAMLFYYVLYLLLSLQSD